MISDPLFSRLFASLLTARELERERIARLLHDQVGQVLSAVGLQLDAVRLDFGDRTPELSERSVEIQQMLEQAMHHVRELSSELNPAIAERAGLQSALQQLFDRVRPVFPGRTCLNFGPGLAVAKPLAGALYKIAEQAVENVVRHSAATYLAVNVRALKNGLVMEVRDNGRGFELTRTRPNSLGLGLHLMAHYAAQCDARIKVVSAPNAGATVRVTWGGGVRGSRKKSPAANNDLVKAHAE